MGSQRVCNRHILGAQSTLASTRRQRLWVYGGICRGGWRARGREVWMPGGPTFGCRRLLA